MTPTREVLRALGGDAVFGNEIPTALDLHDRIRAGLPTESVQHFAQRYRISRQELGELLGVGAQTLGRRCQEARLTPVLSERLWRVAQVLGVAEHVLGSGEKARAWLQRPNRALGGYRPMALVSTDVGAGAVRDALGRLAHGVWS